MGDRRYPDVTLGTGVVYVGRDCPPEEEVSYAMCLVTRRNKEVTCTKGSVGRRKKEYLCYLSGGCWNQEIQ